MSAAISLRKALGGLVVAAGIVAALPGTAHASGDLTVRLAPLSNTALFVDVSGASMASTARIIQWPVSGDNQVWTFRAHGTNYELVNKHSNMCLGTDRVAGDQLFQAPCDGNDGEIWAYDDALDNSLSHTIWNPASFLFLDVYGGGAAWGAAIDAWPFNGYTANGAFVQGPKNQEFYFENA
jgi:hypothetical protein